MDSLHLNFSYVSIRKLVGFVCLCPILSWSQIGIHGDVHLTDASEVGFLSPSLYFVEGVVQSPNNTARVYIAPDLEWEQKEDNGHIATVVEIDDHPNFIFPVGDTEKFHPLGIHQAPNTQFSVNYRSSSVFDNQLSKDLEALAPFHWVVTSDGPAAVSLIWNAQSSISALTNDLKGLTFVGYNGTSWEEIPAKVSAVDLLNQKSSNLEVGSIRSNDELDFSTYTHLSLARKTVNTDLLISEAFTPNGDGINEVWYIHNASRYPSMKIRVYNRWGAEVFSTENGYDNRWDGRHKNQSKALPSASYFFQIDSDGDGEIDHQGWVYIHY